LTQLYQPRHCSSQKKSDQQGRYEIDQDTDGRIQPGELCEEVGHYVFIVADPVDDRSTCRS